jgi:hypothetical protein
LVGVVVATVVTIVTRMNLTAAVGMVIVFTPLPAVGGVMTHPRAEDRGWIRGGPARGIRGWSPRSLPGLRSSGVGVARGGLPLIGSPCAGGFRGSGIIW